MLENQSGVDGYEDTVNDLPPGTKLMYGQYTIEQYLSSGGFGITYLAQDSLNRLVVIKECFPSSFCRRTGLMVRPHSRENAEELAKIVSLFTQEALSLARVEHPNIVGVHQVFEENNTAYMALDFVRGRDLQDIAIVNKIELSPEQLTSILIKILDAIGHVHENGLLHRDISPDNIIVRDDGEPVLIDFGAAREQSTRKTRVLSAMQIVKDGYSPQEFYVADSNQSPSCDLYSLAATFYHIITGDRPPDAQRRITALASKEPDPYRPLLGMDTGYDDAFSAVLDRALQVLPKDRVQSAEEWLRELGRTATRRRISKRVLEPEVILPETPAEDTDEASSSEVTEATPPLPPSNVAPFEPARAKRTRPRTSVKRPVDLVEIVATPDADASEDPLVEFAVDPADEDPDDFDGITPPKVKRASSRLFLPSIISVQNDHIGAGAGGARGAGSRFLMTAVLAGAAVLGGLYLMRDGAAPLVEPDAAAPEIAALQPEAENAPKAAVFPDSSARTLPDQPPATVAVAVPLVQDKVEAALPAVTVGETSGIARPFFEEVVASEAIAALPLITDAPTLPVGTEPPLALADPVAVAVQERAPEPTPEPQAAATAAAGADETVELTSITEDVVVASKLVGDQWVTSVVSASSDSVLRVGDVIIADVATGTELNTAESIRAMLENGRSEGRRAVDLAIERNGAFRLESLGL